MLDWDTLGTLLGMILAVVAVLCLAYFATRLLAGRGMGGALGRFAAGQSQNLRVLERVALGQDQCLMVVQAGRHWLLLGVTASSVTLLRELDAAEAASLWPEPPEGGQRAPQMGFQDALRAALRRKKD